MSSIIPTLSLQFSTIPMLPLQYILILDCAEAGEHYFPSSKPPYRFSKVVSFWIFLSIRLGLGLGLGLE